MASLSFILGIHEFLTFIFSWIIDPETSAHMGRNPSILSSLKNINSYPFISFGDGCLCNIKGY